MGYIYKITNLTNQKCYIGQTNRNYKERWAEHQRDKNRLPYCNWPLYKMLNNTEPHLVKWEVIEEVPNDLLNQQEQYWIKYYDSKDNGYNCTYGGYNGTKFNYDDILQYWLNEGERNFTKTAEYFGLNKIYLSKVIRNLGYNRRDWSEINQKDHDDIKRKVLQIDPNTGIILNTFDSLIAAGTFLGDPDYSKSISNVCKGRHKTFHDFCWQYIEDIGKPINLNQQQKTIVLIDYNLSFGTLNDCAEWFIKNNKTRSRSITTVASGIRYGLNHSKTYQNIRIEEREKIIYSHYE